MALGNGGRVRMTIGLRSLEEGDAITGGGSDADAGRQVAIPAAQIAPSVDDLAGRTAVDGRGAADPLSPVLRRQPQGQDPYSNTPMAAPRSQCGGMRR